MADLFVAARTGGSRAGKRAPKADGKRGPVVAEYIYRDASGNPVARKLRHEPGAGGKNKDFGWKRWENGKWVYGLASIKPPLYRLPEIMGEPFVILVEGEKDADSGAKIGLPTTTSGGTDSWREDHGDSLRGKGASIIADADQPGRQYAQKVAASLYRCCVPVSVIELPGAKDLTEFIQRGGSAQRVWELVDGAPQWKPASGGETLDAVYTFIRRFVRMSDSQARVVALWTAHTHAFDAADCTPYLSVNSAEKQSGKTLLLEVLRLLVSHAWLTCRVSAAVLYRKIDAEHPTLLLDESDTAFSSDKEYAEALRGVLNSGYRRSGAASCCVGQGANISYRDFSTFCAKAIAGIGHLPDTVADRSIPIRLKRAKRGQTERFREREAQREASEIQTRLSASSEANLETLRNARPEIPPELSDRQADVCEPLLAVADLAGADWPEAARCALVELCAQAQAADESHGVIALADIRRTFYPHDEDGNPLQEPERIASDDLARYLGEMEGRPWAEWGKSHKPISKHQLARLLERYGIAPRPMRLPDGRRLRGYERDQFTEAWELYLPPDSPLSPLSPQSKP
jgi:hypothetical protein